MLTVTGSRYLRAGIYRFCAPVALLLAFLGMAYLYKYGDRHLYENILTTYGVVPFRFPFLDISFPLAAWECSRQGIDVILSDPCDVLHRSFNYSPLWIAGAAIPLGVADTPAVGWVLDLLFILSLSLLPPPKRGCELALVVMATLSTMVVFALERAHPDILLFMMTLSTGFFAEGRLVARLLGYGVALLAAFLKYYPIMVLIIVFRERIAVFLTVLVVGTGVLGILFLEYHVEIARVLALIPGGRYDTDLFAAKNLPFLVGLVAESAAEPSNFAALLGRITTVSLYAALLTLCLAISRRLMRAGELPAALTSLPRLEQVFLVIGSAVITGCFFAGQSVGYRGVFLLLAMPGLLALSRSPVREVRAVSLGTCVVIVLLMWGECLRLALHQGLEQWGVPEPLASEAKIQFWLVRELCWWWVVGVMLTILTNFLSQSPIVCRAAPLFRKLPARLY